VCVCVCKNNAINRSRSALVRIIVIGCMAPTKEWIACSDWSMCTILFWKQNVM